MDGMGRRGEWMGWGGEVKVGWGGEGGRMQSDAKV